ncbi:MAG: NAD-dependent epimerase/dehydratase family protein [Planctomycetota bacterium]|jgi:dihydroflavonol-4-reductase
MGFRKILITGGCGFLGQYVTKDLLDEFGDLRIKILDLKPNPDPLFDFSDNPSVEFLFNRDICDYDSIEKEFRNIDSVMHLAGLVSFSLQDKDLLERVNVQGTRNVLKAAAFNKIESFLHISSVAALGYNDDNNKAVDETFDFDWDIAKHRKKYYMLTKHLADVEVERFAKKGLKSVILYPGLMFGPGDLTNSARLIRAIRYGKIPFNMPGGTSITDVRDVSRGILTIFRKGITEGAYLLSGHNLTFRQINKTIADALSVRCPRLTLPKVLSPLLFNLLLFVESITKNKLELTADNLDSAFKFRYFDNTKAKKELGWEPEISFEQTIKDTIKWMDKNGHFEK